MSPPVGRLSSPALIADGNHARVDGFVSLGVVAGAAVVAGWADRRPDVDCPEGRAPCDEDQLIRLAVIWI
jgi:hypothetical protein